MTSRGRAVWVQVHLWLGLVAGLLFALIGATGSVLVLGEPLMRWQVGAGLYPQGEAPDRADWSQVDGWIERARRANPGIDIEGAFGPNATPVPAGVVLVVGHAHDSEGGFGGHVVIPIDVATGTPRASFVFEKTVIGVVMGLHTHLLLDPWGYAAVPWLALLLVVSLVTGVVLWWPRAGRWWAALTVRWRQGGRREWLSWHNAVAVWTLPVLVVVWLSGIWLLKPGWFEPAVAAVSPIREPDLVALAQRPARCGAAQTLGDAVAVAQSGHPGLVVRAASQPEAAGDPFFVALRPAGGDGRAMSTEVWVDRSCPEIVFARTGHDLSSGEWLKSEMRPIHADLRLGVAGQALVAASGLSLPLAWVTGVVLWWRWRRRPGTRRLPGVRASSPG